MINGKYDDNTIKPKKKNYFSSTLQPINSIQLIPAFESFEYFREIVIRLTNLYPTEVRLDYPLDIVHFLKSFGNSNRSMNVPFHDI